MRRDSQHRHFSLVDIGRVRVPAHVVEIQKHHQRSPRRALVAIRKRMVPSEPANEHRGFLDHVDVELVTTELGPRRM